MAVQTDDTTAIQMAIDTGVVNLGPGKSYRLDRELFWAHTQGPLVINAVGATVTYTGSGTMFTATMAQAAGGLPTIYSLGGTWVGTDKATGSFMLSDVRGAMFDKPSFRGFTNASAVVLSNDHWWCERNSFRDPQVRDCNRAVQFQVTGGTGSFARTSISNILLSGGTPGVAQIDMDETCNVYDSDIGPIHGNLTSGVIAMHLDGGMGGTVIRDIGLEQTNGTEDAYVFSVGKLTAAPTVRGPVKLRSTQLYLAPPTNPPKWSVEGGPPLPATKLGAVVGKRQVFDETGASLGFIPIYNWIR